MFNVVMRFTDWRFPLTTPHYFMYEGALFYGDEHNAERASLTYKTEEELIQLLEKIVKDLKKGGGES